MSKLLPFIVLLVAAIAGGAGGYYFKLQSTQPPTEHATADDAHVEGGDGDKEEKKKNKKKGHGGGHGKGNETDSVYMKFGRQFVVPVVQNGRPRSMVIMEVNIEVDSNLGESIYAYEPRLRDAMLSHLLQIAAKGDLPTVLEDNERLTMMKDDLLVVAQSIIGDGAMRVLIQDIGIQNY